MIKPRTAEAFSVLLSKNDVCKTLTTVNNWFTVFQSSNLSKHTNQLKDSFGANEEKQIAAIESMSKLIVNMKFGKSPSNKVQKKQSYEKRNKEDSFQTSNPKTIHGGYFGCQQKSFGIV